MEKLEQYLDQVCRSIGGPRALRQHVRQELREHLLDAAAGHRKAGLSEEQALIKAIEDFGGAEQVRSELEATHGHRLMPVVIDKAMQWKEKTMKAKWLWTTWAYIALVIVILGEVWWIAIASTHLTPRFEKLLRDGLIDPAILEESRMAWMVGFLRSMGDVGGYVVWILLLVAVAVGLFEWRVKSENKPFMRLSALGTTAVGLMVLAVLTAVSLVIPYMMGAPATGRVARSYAIDQMASIDTSVKALEQGLPKKDWEGIQEHASRASKAVDRLAKEAPAVGQLTPQWGGSPTLEELQSQLKSANASLREAQQAGRDKDEGKLKMALQKFHEQYQPIEMAANRLER